MKLIELINKFYNKEDIPDFKVGGRTCHYDREINEIARPELNDYINLSTILKRCDNNLDYELKEVNQDIKLHDLISKAIDKLYYWGEALNPIFQKEMLEILQGEKTIESKNRNQK